MGGNKNFNWHCFPPQESDTDAQGPDAFDLDPCCWNKRRKRRARRDVNDCCLQGNKNENENLDMSGMSLTSSSSLSTTGPVPTNTDGGFGVRTARSSLSVQCQGNTYHGDLPVQMSRSGKENCWKNGSNNGYDSMSKSMESNSDEGLNLGVRIASSLNSQCRINRLGGGDYYSMMSNSAVPVSSVLMREKTLANMPCLRPRGLGMKRRSLRLQHMGMAILLCLILCFPDPSIAANSSGSSGGSESDKDGFALKGANSNLEPVPNKTPSKNYSSRNQNTNTITNINTNANAATVGGSSGTTSSTNNKNMNEKLSRRIRQQKNDEFLKWCQTALGIQTLLSIHEFEYVDHMHEWKERNTHESSYSSSSGSSSSASSTSSSSSQKTFFMRGLAATRDISEGEVVISVPYHALISLHTTIDHDPVLSRILGPEARRKYGWTLHRTKSKNRSSRKGKEQSGNDKDEDVDVDDEVMAGDMLYRLDGGTIDTFHGHGGTMSYYEIALLIVALLYHASLGRLSPLAIYIDSLLDAPVDSMPYLWTEEELEHEMGFGMLDTTRDSSGSAEKTNSKTINDSGFRIGLTSTSPSIWEVIKLVRGIQKDVRDMYDDVMVVLMEEHPDIFGHSVASSSEEWAFSYKKFEWAFAMVNSRHWHLPLEDLDEVMVDLKRLKEVPDPAASHNGYGHGQHNQDTESTTTVDAVNSMPATQPTDEYVSSHDEATKMEHIEEYIAPPSTATAATPSPAYLKNKSSDYGLDGAVSKHSFMAPLADMLNFGPPCTRGQYNPSTKAFEVIATCPFLKGQEVTFWYSDDCDNVIIANYGFTHPMVPRCPTIEDWKYRSQMWKEYAETLEKTLSEAYEDLYDMLDELKDCRVRSDERLVGRRKENHGNGDNGSKNGSQQFRRKEGNVRADEDGKENLGTEGRMKLRGDEVDNHGRIRKVKKRPNANILEREEIGL